MSFIFASNSASFSSNFFSSLNILSLFSFNFSFSEFNSFEMVLSFFKDNSLNFNSIIFNIFFSNEAKLSLPSFLLSFFLFCSFKLICSFNFFIVSLKLDISFLEESIDIVLVLVSNCIFSICSFNSFKCNSLSILLAFKLLLLLLPSPPSLRFSSFSFSFISILSSISSFLLFFKSILLLMSLLLSPLLTKT